MLPAAVYHILSQRSFLPRAPGRIMSVDYSLDVRNARLQQGVDAIDAGAGNGVLRLLDGSGVVLSSLALAKPCATVVAGRMNFNGLSLIDPATVGIGVATRARIEDSAGTVVIDGLTVSNAAGADIVLTPSNVIAAGEVIAILAASILSA